MMVLFGLKNCDTCKKALKSLNGAGYAVDFIDVRADGVSGEHLAQFYAEFDQSLVNTRSTTWRGLPESDRSRPALELLAEHPTLMKRPVIEHNDALTLGWAKDVQQIYL